MAVAEPPNAPRGGDTNADAGRRLDTDRRVDRDGDGFADWEDFCPEQAEDVDDCNDADGCPDPDNDRDGIPDAVDGCPFAPPRFNGVNGCPGPQPPGTVMIDDTDHCFAMLEPVYFEPDDATLTRAATALLDELARYLAECPDALILEAVGRKGSGDVAPGLAEQRAEQVRAHVLRARGIDARRMRARAATTREHVSDSAGRTRKEAARRSRRVDFLVVRLQTCPLR